MILSARLGGSPGWWLRQDDRMLATGVDVILEMN